MALKKITEPEKEVVVTEVPEVKVQEKKPKFGKIVNCKRVNVRKAASVESNVLNIIEADEIVTIINKTGEFNKVKTSTGIVGFVMSEFIEAE